MSYTETQELAARMVGCDWAGLLHSDLVRTIERAEARCECGGEKLGAQALIAIITAWELTHEDARMIGD